MFCFYPRAFLTATHQARKGRLGRTLFSRGQPYNVVLTHIVADFDSLAAAVGVAKLWNLADSSVRARHHAILALSIAALSPPSPRTYCLFVQ